MTSTPTLDAVGRPIAVGDTVGGTVESHPDTIVGTVISTTTDTVVVETKPTVRWTLLRGRAFFLGRPLVGVLRDLSLNLAETGPALFYVAPEEPDETRTIFRADHGAPDDKRERDVCHALLDHALYVASGLRPAIPGVDDGPALIYAASDRASVTRVDTGRVEDDRERAICRGLLKHAIHLAEQPIPIRVDEHGHIQP